MIAKEKLLREILDLDGVQAARARIVITRNGGPPAHFSGLARDH
jgi:hypothetical protein